MSQSETLHDLFVDELKDAYDAEKQLIKALRKMSKAATHRDLRDAFASHLEETTGQVATLEEVFGMIDMKPKGKHCPGIAGIIEEGNDAIQENDKSPLLDAALVGSGKRAEHYEIAAYMTLVAMARELGLNDAAERLNEILLQEVACDQKLDKLAAALFPLANAGDDDADDDDESSSAARHSAKKAAVKQAPAKKAAGKKALVRR